jgi:hypothetical protein
MPIFAGFLGAMIAGLAEFLAGWMTRKVAIYLALTVAVAASWAALMVAVAAVVTGLSSVVPSMVSTAVAFIFPSNFGTVIAGAVAIEGVVAGFRLHMGNLRAAASSG